MSNNNIMRLFLFILCLLHTHVYAVNQPSYVDVAYKSQSKVSGLFYQPEIFSMVSIIESTRRGTDFFRLQSNSNIYVLDFATLQEQGLTMNRMALLIESDNAPKNRVVNDAEMTTLISQTRESSATLYLGHDFKLESVALFFNLVVENKIKLNSYEETLKNTLLKNHLLSFDGHKYKAAKIKALVTVSKTQKNNPASAHDETITKVMRQFIVQHELSHGYYFTNDQYYQYCQDFWNNKLTSMQRKSFRDYLQNKYYDKNQEDLMINEFQAFLAYTGTEFGDLFEKGKLKNISSKEALKLRKQFISGSTSGLPVLYSN